MRYHEHATYTQEAKLYLFNKKRFVYMSIINNMLQAMPIEKLETFFNIKWLDSSDADIHIRKRNLAYKKRASNLSKEEQLELDHINNVIDMGLFMISAEVKV